MGKRALAKKKKKAVILPGLPRPEESLIELSDRELYQAKKTLMQYKADEAAKIEKIIEYSSAQNNSKCITAHLLILIKDFHFNRAAIQRFIDRSKLFSQLYYDTTGADDEDALYITDVVDSINEFMGEGWVEKNLCREV